MAAATCLRRPATQFTFSAVFVVAVLTAILRSPAFTTNPSVVSWGVTCDLTMTIPLLWYLFVVRSGVARPLTLAPVFVVCTAIAGFLVPRGEQTFLRQLAVLSVPLEVVTIGLIVRRLRVTGAFTRRGDVATQIADAARAVFGDTAAARFVASELAVIYYAVAAWREKPDVPSDSEALTVHERSGWGSVVACLLVVIAAESLGVHLLLSTWSHRAAWIATGLDVYTACWLIGDYQALRLRPTLVRPGMIDLRLGLRWSVLLPREAIGSVERIAPGQEARRRRTLRLVLLDEPAYLIRLNEPAIATGIGGIRRTIDSIAILPDDRAGFEQEFGLS